MSATEETDAETIESLREEITDLREANEKLAEDLNELQCVLRNRYEPSEPYSR